ncbi:MAG TPA: peptidoglycan DD-metalloendopeptidase family protein [Anaerolineae bacterium]|nr:peptidoglycan DD-metalloendopeptidase family protein [Anaerolineae bacterium]HQH37404.1 peptidoglycan DD-metalloendopeptidase family protein [Anaerolineae bacterium]
MTFRMRWPTEYGTITQQFGANPQIYSKFGLPGHEGIDFMAPQGSEIYAVADGFVSDVRLDGSVDPIGKPYGNQVRIQHDDGFESIYAHLAQAVVTRGQFVKAKQLIGLADNTGNSDGSHLHLSLKKQGATAAGQTNYPHDLINPTPYLEPFSGGGGTSPQPPATTTINVQVNSPDVGFLNVRQAPYVGAPVIDMAPHNAILGALEEAAVARSKVGKMDQWLWVRLSNGKVGYVAAWYLQFPPPPPPAEPATVVFVVVDSPDEPLKLRQGPGVGYAQIALMPHGTVLKTLEKEAVVKQKVGQMNQWLNVQTPAGLTGYTAAWYVKLQEGGSQPIIPKPEEGTPTGYVVVESPELGLKVREGPSVATRQVWWVPHKTVLESLEDAATTGSKVGQMDQWIKVRTPARYEGYVAAWYVRYPTQEDERQAAGAVNVPTGVSPYIFGIHAVDITDDPHTKGAIRSLYQGQGKKGWILFTQLCGKTATAIQPNDDIRAFFWEWASQGYGVIVRLNYGYEPGGTLPEAKYYDAFAAAAARWVELFLKRTDVPADDYTWTIQIGNEQNNPREHPGGFDHPTEHITPERYAEAFNKTYARIKAVLPNAIVCPGALDPYNYMPWKAQNNAQWRPLDYYDTMLANIQALDGIILHAYTHGPNLSAVTSLKRFGEGTGPLWDHYYDFQIYRLFMERIPAQWRDVPAYITEMNHIHRPAGEQDQGWVSQNTGWVREVYKEIDRWNKTPYAQQIRCGLLYRWTGDQWAIDNKPGVLDDFKMALANDYRWRTAEAGAFAFAAGAGKAVKPQRAQPLEERVLVRPDDLTRIWGIGEKSEKVLHAAGILIFEQLARLTPEKLRALVGESGLQARHLSTWPEQARMIVKGQTAALHDLQTKLGKKTPL